MPDKIRLTLDGLDELRRQLQKLPEDLRIESSGIIIELAEKAKAEMETAYPIRNYGSRRNRGRLQRSLRIDRRSDNYGSTAILRNIAPHAYIFDHGTAARHTAAGISRGASRPGRVFVPTAIHYRNLMNHALMDLIERSGPFRFNRSQAA